MSQNRIEAEKASYTACIQEMTEDDTGKTYYLSAGTVLMGRNQNAEIPVSGNNISRNHAVLTQGKKGWTITDNRSTNGVFLNGNQIPSCIPKLLKNDMVITLGPPEACEMKYVFKTCSNKRQNPVKESSGSQPRELKRKFLELRADKPEPSCSKSQLDFREPEEEFHPKVPKRATQSLTPTPTTSENNEPCEQNPEPSLKERLEAFDRQLRLNDKVRQKVEEMLRSSQESEKRKNESLLDDSQSLLHADDFNEGNEPVLEEDGEALVSTQESQCLTASENAASSQTKRDNQRITRSTNSTTNSPNKSQSPAKSQADSEELKALREKLALVEQRLKEKEEMETVKDKEPSTSAAEDTTSRFGELMESELTCSICTELFVKATSLACSHTFCSSCITVWKKTKKQCPICRKPIKGEARSLVIDNFIDKMTENLSPEYQERRNNVVAERALAEKKPATGTRGSTTTTRGGRTGQQQTQQSHVDDDVVVVVDNALEAMPYDELSVVTYIDDLYDMSDDDEDSDDSDDYDEGYGYYGGYGRCYNCGRAGHWANGCPYG